jgi:hypothetical protein
MSSLAFDGSRTFFQSAFFQTATIVGSPAAASETIVAQVVLPVQVRADQNVWLFGFCAYIVGTSGTAGTLRLRRTNVGGTIVASTGALVVAATNPVAPIIIAPDAPGAVANQVYVLTLQVTAGAAASTVSAVALFAQVI